MNKGSKPQNLVNLGRSLGLDFEDEKLPQNSIYISCHGLGMEIITIAMHTVLHTVGES